MVDIVRPGLFHLLGASIVIFVAGNCRTVDRMEAAAMTPEIEIDSDLGEEPWPGEVQAAARITRSIGAAVRRRHEAGEGPARRDAHPKAHGCVRATFKVDEHLDPSLAFGVFQPGSTARAWIRFSNGDGSPVREDGKGDARGMAIKLVGVPGPKLSADEKYTQDFVLINHPVFFIDDPVRYASVIEKGTRPTALGRLAAPIALGVQGTLIGRDIVSSRIANPLFERYWSTVPYRLGDDEHKRAIKYSVAPCERRDNEPDPAAAKDPDFLRAAMRATLAERDVCFDLLVQTRTSPTMNVEKATIEWQESDAPFVPVARIVIKQQSFDTPAQHSFCDALSFSPWHALPEHRPLGGVNRVRRVVYDAISALRHELNGEPRIEPTGDESFVP